LRALRVRISVGCEAATADIAEETMGREKSREETVWLNRRKPASVKTCSKPETGASFAFSVHEEKRRSPAKKNTAHRAGLLEIHFIISLSP
jgi:hypothetical protein